MLKQVLHTFISKVALGVFNLLLAVIISQYLGASGKGAQGLIITTISLSVVIAGVIGAGGLTYLAPRFRIGLLYWPSLLMPLLVALGAGLVLSLTRMVPEQYQLSVVILIVIQGWFSLHQALLQANKQILKANYASLLQVAGMIFGAVVFIYGGLERSVTGYIYSLFFGNCVGLVMSFVCSLPYLRGVFRIFQNPLHLWIAIRRLFHYGFFNQLDIFTQMLSFRFAYYVLWQFEDLALVGIYSNGVALVEAVWLISRSLTMVQHAQIVNSRNAHYKVRLTITFAQLAFILSLLAVGVMLLIPSGFYQWLFGREFGGVRNVIASLSVGVIGFSMSFVFSGYFSGIGRHSVNSRASIAGLLVTIVGVWFFTPLWGFWGAGLASSLAYITTTVFKWQQLQRQAQLPLRKLLPDKEFMQQLSRMLKY